MKSTLSSTSVQQPFIHFKGCLCPLLSLLLVEQTQFVSILSYWSWLTDNVFQNLDHFFFCCSLNLNWSMSLKYPKVHRGVILAKVSVRWSRTEDWPMSCLARLYFLVCALSFLSLLPKAYYLLWYSSQPISKEMLLSQLCCSSFLLEYILILWNSVSWFLSLYLQYWPRA